MTSGKALDVLLLGFSVTGDGRGFAYQMAKEDRPLADFLFRPCGLGGMHPFALPFLLDRIQTRSDVIVFEIFTSDYRKWGSISKLEFAIFALINFCRSRGIVPIFVNLFRTDVDYDHDDFWDMAACHFQAHDVQHLNLAPIMRNECERQGYQTLFKDEVHPTDAGTAVYKQALSEFLTTSHDKILAERARLARSRPFRYSGFSAVEFAGVAGSEGTRLFARDGFSVPLAIVPAGKSVEVSLRTDMLVHGVDFLMGPATASFSVAVGELTPVEVAAFDKYCYYERLQSVELAANRGAQLVVTQSSDRMPIELLKGSRAEDGPFGYLRAAYCSRLDIAAMTTDLARLLS